ncbi:hypothetical protein A2U01_0049115 [Trifolium medium]|uniref:Uncharacterized protein n=1 Tax=Trifolium medium TaxID=97028 RepID=A0A392QXD0_9FABA|nr:hypothetical protein [Trifolium medium]
MGSAGVIGQEERREYAVVRGLSSIEQGDNQEQVSAPEDR